MTGVVNSVSSWLTIRPPTMATPSGRRSSEPAPELSIKGSAPSRAAMVVIRMGLKRSSEAWYMASRAARPPLRCASRAKSIIMMAFFFTMPINRMMPMMPSTSRSSPAIIRASMAPIPADGNVERIVTG